MNKIILGIIIGIIILIGISFLFTGSNINNTGSNINNTGSNINNTGSNINNTGSNINNILSYDKLIKDINNMNNINDYNLLKRKYSGNIILTTLFKEDLFDSYVKYWSFTFDEYVFKKDTQILQLIESNGGSIVKAKKVFLDLLIKKRLDIPKIRKQLSNSDLLMDINIYFNNIELKEALSNCKKIIGFIKDYNDSSLCENKIYFYRANKYNNYCNNIVNDDLMKNICLSGLKQ